jgi:hypothetical protein
VLVSIFSDYPPCKKNIFDEYNAKNITVFKFNFRQKYFSYLVRREESEIVVVRRFVELSSILDPLEWSRCRSLVRISIQ